MTGSDTRRTSIEAANSRFNNLVGWVDNVLPFSRLRPLDGIPSVKLKVSIVIGAAISITIVILTVSDWFDLQVLWGIAAAIVVSIVLVQILSRGLTAPLTEMMRAADDMAAGNYDQRVTATAADEVGELARSFNAMAAQIADLERQRRELIANVSHELRTPIAALQGNLENLLDNVAEDRDETLETMQRQSVRLGRLVGQLMDLSRFEAGALPIHPVRVDLVAVIEDALAEARLHVPEARIVFDAPQELLIDGDPERLHQVIGNLVENAMRYNPEGEAIRVFAEHTDDGAAVVVEDRGPGIPDEDFDRIFERFHMADADRSAGTGGTGLGLAISRWIVGLHGGTITASNSQPHGCTMTVRLPKRLG